MNLKKKHCYRPNHLFLISMYVNNNKIHGIHGIHDQVQAFHDFVDRVIGGLPPANHDGALTNGTMGDPMFELVNDKRNALVH